MNNMNWEEAQIMIRNAMVIGSNINTNNSTDRKIVAVDVPLDKYDYNGALGFQVKIGVASKKQISIPWEILEVCFAQLNTKQGYNVKFYKENFPRQYNHPCHVHTVGQIFMRSGIAEARGSKCSPSYFLINH